METGFPTPPCNILAQIDETTRVHTSCQQFRLERNERNDRMSGLSKNLVIVSLVLTGIVGVASILDLAMGIPYGRNIPLDIMFLLGAGLIGYMGYETFKDYQ